MVQKTVEKSDLAYLVEANVRFTHRSILDQNTVEYKFIKFNHINPQSTL